MFDEKTGHLCEEPITMYGGKEIEKKQIMKDSYQNNEIQKFNWFSHQPAILSFLLLVFSFEAILIYILYSLTTCYVKF